LAILFFATTTTTTEKITSHHKDHIHTVRRPIPYEITKTRYCPYRVGIVGTYLYCCTVYEDRSRTVRCTGTASYTKIHLANRRDALQTKHYTVRYRYSYSEESVRCTPRNCTIRRKYPYRVGGVVIIDGIGIVRCQHLAHGRLKCPLAPLVFHCVSDRVAHGFASRCVCV